MITIIIKYKIKDIVNILMMVILFLLMMVMKMMIMTKTIMKMMVLLIGILLLSLLLLVLVLVRLNSMWEGLLMPYIEGVNFAFFFNKMHPNWTSFKVGKMRSDFCSGNGSERKIQTFCEKRARIFLKCEKKDSFTCSSNRREKYICRPISLCF